MAGPVLWGPNSLANNLEAGEILSTGALLNQPGVPNYIPLGNFANGLTTGWSLGTVGTLTNGIPTGTPTFGSGASGNLSIATTSSTQAVSGSPFALQYISSAATTQGNMLASSVLSLPTGNQANPLQFSFYYSLPSGASTGVFGGTSSDSFGVAVYDVTNSAWLGNTSNFGFTQITGCGVVLGTFQPAINTTQVRIVVYNVNATTGAITLNFTDFNMTPTVHPQGAVVTDWIAFTPTGTWTSNAAYVGQYRRVGKNAQIQVSITLSGAPTAASLDINLPTGLSIDTTALSSSVVNSLEFGGGTTVGNGTAYFFRAVYQSTTSIRVLNEVPSGISGSSGVGVGFGDVNATTPKTFASGETISVSFEVPIVGWSSNVEVSSTTDTRVVAFGCPSFAPSIAGNSYATPVQITGLSAYLDTHGGYASNAYKIPVSGIYDINISAFSDGTSFSRYIQVWKNGATTGIQFSGQNAQFSPFGGTTTLQLNAGDSITLYGGNANTAASTWTIQTFTIARRSGPSVIAATESVNARYINSSGQSIPNASGTIITNWTKDFDTHAAFNATTGTYTIPVSGKYRVVGLFNLSIPASTALAAVQAVINHNGSTHTNGPSVNSTSSYGGGTTDCGAMVNALVNCLAGDTINFVAVQSTGGSRSMDTLSASNVFSIERVGN